MSVLIGLIKPLQAVNVFFGRVGRTVTIVAMVAMVAVILLQVFCRYVLNNALPWPDEAARFFMLWMTGLIAPFAYRRGGFVAIDLLGRSLPRPVGAFLNLLLLGVSLVVLIVAIQLGHKHTMSGCLFKSASLWIPFTVQFAIPVPLTDVSLTLCTKDDFAFGITWGWSKLPLALSYASLFFGVILLTLVNIELILRSLVMMGGGEDRLDPVDGQMLGSE